MFLLYYLGSSDGTIWSSHQRGSRWQGEALHPVLPLGNLFKCGLSFMHIPTLKSNALLSGLKTFYPKFHCMEWVYKDFVLGVVIRAGLIKFGILQKKFGIGQK